KILLNWKNILHHSERTIKSLFLVDQEFPLLFNATIFVHAEIPDPQETMILSFRKDDKIIVSCGSGISACTNIVALKRSGFRNVMLYPGSYSDWISYDEDEIETRGE